MRHNADLTEWSTHQNLMGVHWPRQKEGSIMWSVELITQDVNGGNPLDVVLSAKVGGQKTTKLHQGVVTLQEYKETSQKRHLLKNI